MDRLTHDDGAAISIGGVYILLFWAMGIYYNNKKNNSYNNNEMSGEGIELSACSVGVTMMWARTDYLSLVVEQRTRKQYYYAIDSTYLKGGHRPRLLFYVWKYVRLLLF